MKPGKKRFRIIFHDYSGAKAVRTLTTVGSTCLRGTFPASAAAITHAHHRENELCLSDRRMRTNYVDRLRRRAPPPFSIMSYAPRTGVGARSKCHRFAS